MQSPSPHHFFRWHHPTLVTDMTRQEVNLSDAIMTHGKGFILGMNRCELCGQKDGLKMKCSYSNCRQRGNRSKASHAHVTCARQAGFEVDTGMEGDDVSFHISCYRHVKCEFAFRARLEDLIEFEKLRIGKKMDDARSMSISHASRLLNSAIVVMNYLGWAWRWAEWWVEYGSNWEPLIEPGQDEKKMSKEQLKIVDSTAESRCADARRCRLAAFGAALRNRSYDDVEDGPTVMLERALRAVLNTPALVGPLTNLEIDFFVQWLGIAYRSNSRLLGFGAEKIVVDETAPSSIHEDDKSPKFVLGGRRLPGEQVLSEGEVFETNFTEIDDFLKPERLEDGMLYSEFLKTKKVLKQKHQKYESASISVVKNDPDRLKRKHSSLHGQDDQRHRKMGDSPKAAPSEFAARVRDAVEESNTKVMKGVSASPNLHRKHEYLDGLHPAPSRKKARPPKDAPRDVATPIMDASAESNAAMRQQDSDSPHGPRKVSCKEMKLTGHGPSTESDRNVEGRAIKKRKTLAFPDRRERAKLEHLGRGSRKSGKFNHAEESDSEGTKVDDWEFVGKKSSSADWKSFNEDSAYEGNTSSPKCRRRQPKRSKAEVATHDNGATAIESQENCMSLRPRRKTVGKYREEDCDFIADDEPQNVAANASAQKKSPLQTEPYVIPRKGRARSSIPEEGGATEHHTDPDDTDPLSSLRIPRKQTFFVDDAIYKDDCLVPERDLSSPQTRGRYRGKLEAAKFVLRREDRSVL